MLGFSFTGADMIARVTTADRAHAKESGAAYYHTGISCANGHTSFRRTRNGECLKCGVDKNRNRRKADPKLASRESREWRERHPERYLSKLADYRAENREYFRAYNRAYASANLEQFRAKNATRRAARRCAVPLWFSELDDFVIQEAADLCRRREAVTGFAWHIDHMIPLQARIACGLHCAANFQVIPAYLNLWKRNRMLLTRPGEWIGGAK